MPIYIFHTKERGTPLSGFSSHEQAIERGKSVAGLTKIEFAPTCKIIWERSVEPKFKIGDTVRKTKGSEWSGKVCGTYSTVMTGEGYCVESDVHKNSVQIYPASALEKIP